MESFGEVLSAFGEWILASEWRSDYLTFNEEFAEFFEGITDRNFGESLGRLSEEASDTFTTVALERYLSAHPDDRLVRGFGKSGVSLSPAQKAYIRQIWRSVSSLYEVVESVPGSHIVLKDLVREGGPVTVRERSASCSLVKFDLLMVRVVTVDRITQITGGTLPIPREWWPFLSKEMARLVKRHRKEMRSILQLDESLAGDIGDLVAEGLCWYAIAAWLATASPLSRERPEVRNRDGDKVEMISLAYPILGRGIAHALNQAADFAENGDSSWTWLQDHKGESIVHAFLRIEDDRMLAECNSKERGKELTKRLTKLLGDRVGRPLRMETSLEEAQKYAPEPGPTLMETLGPGEREQLAAQLGQMVLEKYLRMLDEVVPMLHGSPRELVKTKDGRAQVANWLKLLESSHARAPEEMRSLNLDLTPLWKELGILKLRD